ncbi:MAG: hypothetical protein ACI9VS_000463 [Candidatus Binatia bacterium]|jgi:hypothetical protein
MKFMRISLPLVVAAVAVALFTALPAAGDHHKAPGPKPVEDSMHEFMEYVFEPGYKRLKKNMAAEPKDKNSWKAIKGDALALAEATNLLFQRKPEKDSEAWVTHAATARTKGAAFYAAARKRDYAAATKTYQAMLQSCNACHKQFAEGKHQLKP